MTEERTLRNLIRLSRIEVEQRRDKIVGLEALQKDLLYALERLAKEAQAERIAAAESTPGTINYAAFRVLHEEKERSTLESKNALEDSILRARQELQESFQTLKRYQILGEKEQLAQKKITQQREEKEFEDTASSVATGARMAQKRQAS